MPIDVQCEDCGKKLRLRDNLAGKRIKCPGCGEALDVPAALEEIEDEPEERPAPRKTAVRSADARPAIKRSRDDDEDDQRPAPKRRRDDDDEDDEERPAAKRRRDDDEDDDERPSRRSRDDEEDEEDDRPRPKKKGKKSKKGGGSSLPLILGIVAAVLLLLGGAGVGLLFLFKGGGASADLLAFIPGDGLAFVSVRVSDAVKTEAGKALADKAKQAVPGFGANPQNPALNLQPEDITRMTYVFKESQAVDDAFYAILETNRPVDRAKVKSELTNPTDVTHEGKTYTAGTYPAMPGGRWAVYIVNNNMVVVGGESAVKRAISVSLKPRVAGPLDDGIALLSSGKHLIAGFNLPPSAVTQMRNMAAQPSAKQFAALTEFQSGTVTVNVSSALDIEAGFKFPGDAQAQAAKTAAEKGVAAAQVGIGAFKANVQAQDQAAFGAAENALNSIKVQQQGQRMTVTMKFDGVANAINQMPRMMMPGPGMPGPGMPGPGMPGPGPKR